MIARQELELTAIADTLADDIRKIEPKELHQMIHHIRTNLTWGSYFYSFLPSFMKSTPAEQPKSSLEIAIDIFKDTDCKETSVNARLLSEFLQKANIRLQHAQIFILNRLVHKSLTEPKKIEEKKENLQIAVYESVKPEEKKVKIDEQVKEKKPERIVKKEPEAVAFLRANTIFVNTKSAKKNQPKRKFADKYPIAAKIQNKKPNVPSIKEIHQPVSRSFKR